MTRPVPRAVGVARPVPPARAMLAAALLAAAAAAGCDNPACVFSPNQCRDGDGGGGPGGIGSAGAVFPSDAAWLAPAAPVVVRTAPAIADAHPETPLLVEFDQSLDPGSLSGAFELFDTITFAPVPLLDPPALVGDGRVVVLTVPAVGGQSPLVPGSTYVLRFKSDQQIADVTGQPFDFGTSQDILEIGIAATPPVNPRVVYSYPADDAILVSDLTEVVVVFDRTMNDASFSVDSFEVTVGGMAPTPNPPPASLILTGLPVPQSVLQVWSWKSADANGVRQSLGADAKVRVRLSPMGFPLTGGAGGTLAQTDVDFRTALVRAPASVRKAAGALPPDAIGGLNLDSGGVLEVMLADAAGAADTLELFIIGGSPANPQLLKAEQRSMAIPAGATSIVLGEAELDLREPNSVARFRDGEIEFMARVRRGMTATVARRTDGDPDAGGFQRLFQDLTPPRLLGLGIGANSVTFVRSELGGIVVEGRADEEIRYARVSTSEGDNHTGPSDRPAVALSSPGGRFIAAPVAAAPNVLDPARMVSYTVEVFDRALNAAVPPAIGMYQQIGAVGPGAAPVGGDVTVRVYDADTAELLDGALVMSHSDDGATLTELGAAATVGGVAMVPSAIGAATVVTVQRTGYDSFTLLGVPVDRLDVPLQRAGVMPAMISGTVVRPLTTDFQLTVNWLGDSRALQPDQVLVPTSSCGLSSTGQPECNYGPFSVRAQQTGLTSFFATNPALPQLSFTGPMFLRSTAFRLSDEALDYGEHAMDEDLAVDPAAEPAVALDGHMLEASGLSTFGMASVAPIATVEGLAHGLEGAPTLGIGNPYSTGATSWLVLGAVPFAATSTGSLVERNAIEADLFLRAELVDAEGNRVGARPRLSSSSGNLFPIDVPRLLVPASGGATGGDAYSLEVDDVIDSAGLYRVVVADPSGRRWHLFAFDPPGLGDVRLAIPPVSGLGGTPLADGLQTAHVSAWAWSDLDPDLFLWADVERRHEAFGHAAPVQFTQD